MDGAVSDEQLMLQFAAGDAAAFDLLFKRYERPILNFIWRFVPIRAIAEELTQDVFIRVFKAGRGYRVKAKFRTWIFTIATNVALKWLKRHEHRYQSLPLESERDTSEMALADERLAKAQRREQLRQAVLRLPHKQQAAVIMRCYQEMSHEEIASVLKLSANAVKSLLHRAYVELERRLQRGN